MTTLVHTFTLWVYWVCFNYPIFAVLPIHCSINKGCFIWKKGLMMREFWLYKSNFTHIFTQNFIQESGSSSLISRTLRILYAGYFSFFSTRQTDRLEMFVSAVISLELIWGFYHKFKFHIIIYWWTTSIYNMFHESRFYYFFI